MNKKIKGFSLVELMITISVLGIISAYAMPAFQTWVQDSKTRTIAESLQNGIRLAQSESLNRGRQVVFFLTNDTPPSKTSSAATNGKNWGIRTIAIGTDLPEDFLQGAVLASTADTVDISATNGAITFNSIGRLTSSANSITYQLTNSKGSRRLNVVVSTSGSVRMCDPAKSISSAADGC